MKIRKSKAIAGAAIAAMMTIGSAAWSDSVHDQSAVDRKAFGWDSVGDGGGQQQIADDFRTGLTGTVTKLSWTGKYHDSSIPAASETGQSANQVLNAADDLARQGEGLRQQVDAFLKSIRAA